MMVAFMKKPGWTSVTIPCIRCKKQVKLNVRVRDLEAWKQGESYVQKLFPYLSASEREMLLSRYCGDCWGEIFPEKNE
jgi:hypothetical protein